MIGKSVASKMGLAAVGAYGFSKGVTKSGAGDSFYELTTGNPNIDEDVLGTNVGPMNLLLNLPGSKTSMMMNGAPGARSGLPRLIASMPTGIVNKKTIAGAFSRSSEPFSTTPNTIPRPDGSIVFGMNNARFGG